jgi:hypothetical protein
MKLCSVANSNVCVFSVNKFIVNPYRKRNKKALMLGIQPTNRHLMGQNDVRFCWSNDQHYRTGILLSKIEHAQDQIKPTWETLHLTNEETINTDRSILLVHPADKPKIFVFCWINFRESVQDPHQTHFDIQ